ncbi:class E sortase [Kitasatospora sp. NPDC050543]|uniref:class E sortase n=1 Tax=Kitasatospora sp. NPDC050543 TaxID=3364054 RepID=UPI0037B9C3A2
MVTEQQAAPADAAGTTRPPRRGPVLVVAGALGETLFTVGVLLALFATYSLWWTDVLAGRRAGQDGERLRGAWSTALASARHDVGEGVGFLHIPALGQDYQVLIKMGTDEETLDEGVAGVYQEPYRSALPWEKEGNFALAAHRDGHGAKFHDLDQVQPGDALVVETGDNWYVYRVDNTLPETSKYDTGVVAPVPTGSGYDAPGRYITLTTCTPVYTSLYRMAVWGSLQRVDAMDEHRTPPPELAS